MKKYIKTVLLLAIGFSILFTTSCSNEMSLQKYFVTKSSEEGFMSITVPSSMLQLKEDAKNDENIEALNSFKRLNVLIFKNTDSTSVNEEKELKAIRLILSNSKYKELMSMNIKGNEGNLSYSGDDENINEVVGFGHNEEGFILVRITGENMKVKELAKLASSIDFEKSDLSSLNLDNL